MSNELSAEQNEQIEVALAAGKKIEAIKLCREFTGQGLKEAKEQIDAMLPALIEKDPVKYQKLAARGGGCASMILLTLTLGWAGLQLLDWMV